jgi:hypothetical protein
MKSEKLKKRLEKALKEQDRKIKLGIPLPNPFKEWSRDSLESLKKALSSK